MQINVKISHILVSEVCHSLLCAVKTSPMAVPVHFQCCGRRYTALRCLSEKGCFMGTLERRTGSTQRPGHPSLVLKGETVGRGVQCEITSQISSGWLELELQTTLGFLAAGLVPASRVGTTVRESWVSIWQRFSSSHENNKVCVSV